jgi:hypothetical protein
MIREWKKTAEETVETERREEDGRARAALRWPAAAVPPVIPETALGTMLLPKPSACRPCSEDRASGDEEAAG